MGGGVKTTGTGAPAAAVRNWRSHDDLDLPPILEAALADFQQHGYHGSTVRGISSRVGVTMPSLYYHYGNKEGILFALLDVAMEDLLAHIKRGMDDAGDDVTAKFQNFITAVALHNTRRHDLATLHDEFRFLGTDSRATYVGKRSIVEQTLEELLREGSAGGVFDDSDPHFTARLLLGMLNGIIDWYHAPGPLTATEIADRYTQAALRLVCRLNP